jgi:hypothetical protein
LLQPQEAAQHLQIEFGFGINGANRALLKGKAQNY